MAYPSSSDVTAGQPTAAAHYNNLRKDALYLGNDSATALTLGAALAQYIENVKLEYLATNCVRIPYDAAAPARIMIDGYMLQAFADVDLAAGSFSGAAAKYYIFAVRALTPTFTLAVSTSSTVTPGSRLIGECYWAGSSLTSYSIYAYSQPQLAPADFDSGWFSVAYNNTYGFTHNFLSVPRVIMLFWSATNDYSTISEIVAICGTGSTPRSPLAANLFDVTIKTGNDSSTGCILNLNGNSGGGYYRVLLWR